MKKKIMALICGIVLSLFPKCTWAADQLNYVEIGPSKVGTLYVDLRQVQTVHKDGAHFLMTAVENRYKDGAFLVDLRKRKGYEKAAGMITVCMFDNYGRTYCEVRKFIFDTDGQLIDDLGGDVKMQFIGKNKTLLDIYTVSLKHLEKKEQTKKWLK